MNESQPNKTIRFTITKADSAAIDLFKAKFKLDKPHEVLRHILLAAYHQELDDQRRYGSRGPAASKVARDERDSRITAMKEMDDAVLTKHLVDIGYSKAPYEPTDEMNTEFREVIWTDAVTSVRYFVQERWNLIEKKRTSSRIVFNFEELIKDMIKDKKL